MGIVAQAALRARDPDLVEKLGRTGVGSLSAHPEVRRERLADLTPDREHRVQSSSWDPGRSSRSPCLAHAAARDRTSGGDHVLRTAPSHSSLIPPAGGSRAERAPSRSCRNRTHRRSPASRPARSRTRSCSRREWSPRSVQNRTPRSSTDSSCSDTATQLRVERLAHGIADQIETEHDEHDREAGEEREERCGRRYRLALVSIVPHSGVAGS